MSGYRPNRSQQIAIAQAIKDKYKLSEFTTVIVHHVLEDTPLKLFVQVEIQFENLTSLSSFSDAFKPMFKRITL